MSSFSEPTEDEEADSYLENFKKEHKVSVVKEPILRRMLVDYFSERKQDSPFIRETLWAMISKTLEACKRKNVE